LAGTRFNDTIKLADPKTPTLVQKFWTYLQHNQVIANMAISGPQHTFFGKKWFFIFVQPLFQTGTDSLLSNISILQYFVYL